MLFISYKTEDRNRAIRIRHALSAVTKLAVWWDQDLQTGGRWHEDIDQALRSAGAVVVLWSERAVASPWVLQEAAIASLSSRLVPARLDGCALPPPFRSFQTADLSDWDGSERHPEFVKLVDAVRVIVGRNVQISRFRVAFVPSLLGLAAIVFACLWFTTIAGSKPTMPTRDAIAACRDHISRLNTVSFIDNAPPTMLRSAAQKVDKSCKHVMSLLEQLKLE
jgi:hypothetical protein